MIKSKNTFSPAVGRYHLGDLINIVQQCCTMTPCNIFGTQVCSCCQNSVEDSLKQILSLLDCDVKYAKSHLAKELWPTWSQKPFQKSPQYQKSFLKASTEPYVAFQFDARSQPANRKKTISQREREILTNSNLELIEIGEKSKLNIRQKFEILNNASAYIGIDSGVTHLALMSNVPIYLIHPPGVNNNPSMFYPDTAQIKIHDNMMDVIKCLQK